MRHRLTIALYEDNKVDCEVLDFLSDLSGHRRMEMLRLFVATGFNNIVKNMPSKDAIENGIDKVTLSYVSHLEHSTNNNSKKTSKKRPTNKITKKKPVKELSNVTDNNPSIDNEKNEREETVVEEKPVEVKTPQPEIINQPTIETNKVSEVVDEDEDDEYEIIDPLARLQGRK